MVDTHAKGSRWRRAVEVWLEEHGFRTSVRGIGYTGDDIVARRGELGFSVECKNQREIRLARFVDQSVASAAESWQPLVPLTVIHRPARSSVDDAYFVLRGSDFLRLVALIDAAMCNNPLHANNTQDEGESRPHASDAAERSTD